LINMQKQILSLALLATAASCQSLSDVLVAQKSSLSTLSSKMNFLGFDWIQTNTSQAY
jgi:hypothetical protein